MGTYLPNEDDRRSLDRCAACDAIVIAEIACGGGDYFDVIMRVVARSGVGRGFVARDSNLPN